MEQDILEQSPSHTITARRLWELTRENAVIIPLTHRFNTIQAYRIDAKGGPYLMLTAELTKYREKCDAHRPQPRP